MKLSEAREAATAERNIYYHGTSMTLYQKIRKEGLIPSPKKRTWDSDPDATATSFDRTSYGGIYVTRDLGTATISGIKAGPGLDVNRLIVVMDLQPRTFIMDEDDAVYPLGSATLAGTNSSTQVHWWLYIDWKYGEGDGSKQVIKSRQEYVESLLDRATKNMGGKLHPDLRSRLVELAPSLWEAVVTRMAAYYSKSNGENWEYHWKREVDNYTNERYKWHDPAFPMPPDPAEAEAQFKKAFDQLTRTMKNAARPARRLKGNYSANARLMTPVGYSGQNRIVALVEELPKYKFKVLYGTIPDDFKKQWDEKIGKSWASSMVA